MHFFIKWFNLPHLPLVAISPSTPSRYRHTRTDSNSFIETLNIKLGEIDCNKNNFYLMGNIILNITKVIVFHLLLITYLC